VREGLVLGSSQGAAGCGCLGTKKGCGLGNRRGLFGEEGGPVAGL